MSKHTWKSAPCFYSIIGAYDQHKGMYMTLITHEIE